MNKMKNIIFFFATLAFSYQGIAQFPAKSYTYMPVFYVSGQSNGVGMGQAVADTMAYALKSHYGVDSVGHVKASFSGSPVGVDTSYSDWNAESIGNGEGDCLDQLATKWIQASGNSTDPRLGDYFIQNYMPDVKVVLWLQGESDAANNQYSDDYEANLKKTIAAYRRIMGKPDLKFILLKMNTLINRSTTNVNKINTAMDNIAAADSNVDVIDCFDFTVADYDDPPGEELHYNTQGLYKLRIKFQNKIISNGW